MLSSELISRMSRAERQLHAQRWGIASMSVPVMVELLRTTRVGHRLYRRISDTGCGTLIRHLIEHGGGPVPRQEGLEYEARIASSWGLVVETDETWEMPADVALSMLRHAESERFCAATLIGRLGPSDLQTLLVELSIPRVGSAVHQACRAAESAVVGTVASTDTRSAAKLTAEIQSMPAKEINRVEYVRGSQGHRYRVHTDEEAFDLAPRELAESAGLSFDPVVVEGRQPAVLASPPKLRLPGHTAIGALVTFSTARAADEALRDRGFRNIVERRLDERRVATVADCSAAEALEVLRGLGFASEDAGPTGGVTYASQ